VGFEPTKAYANRASVLEDFAKFCRIDLRLKEKTAYDHVRVIKKTLQSMNKEPDQITNNDVRDYLATQIDKNPAVYKNILSGLKRFFRDFVGKGHLVNGFKFPRKMIEFDPIPSKKDLQSFYTTLGTPRDRALFLIYATSGLRRNEVISLNIRDLDFKNRMIKPMVDQSRTKHRWISFFNEEAEKALREYLGTRKDPDQRLFPLAPRTTNKIFKKTGQNNGIEITPQVLRKWFCSEMGKLGVPDRYIDAFCGRVPHSVLAMHYSDYSPETLKEIYENASLRVLNQTKPLR